MNAWFLSDIHLKDINERRSVELLRFFSSISNGERPASHLFLLGDIFDLWLGSSAAFIRKFQPIIDALKNLKDQGIEIYYIEGNHDMFLEDYFGTQLGFKTAVEVQLVQVGGYRIRIEHGDLINDKDLAYLRLRATLRSSKVRSILTSIPGGAIDWIGTQLSQISRKFSTQKRAFNQEPLRAMIRNHAKIQFAQSQFDVIVSGHMHILDEYQFETEGKTVLSINLGSWFDGAKAFHLCEDLVTKRLTGRFEFLEKADRQ